MISYIPTSIVLSDLTQLRNIMIVISVICIALLCVLIERVTHVVIKPVKEMTRVITAMIPVILRFLLRQKAMMRSQS